MCRDAARRQHHAVADGGDRPAGIEEGCDERLQHRAFEIVAHARCVAARQQQGIEVVHARVPVTQRREKGRIAFELGIGGAAGGIGAQAATEQHKLLQGRHAAPDIEPLARDHHRIGVGALTIGCGEGDLVPGLAQQLPAHRCLGRIEITCRQRNEDRRHRRERPQAESGSCPPSLRRSTSPARAR